MSNTVTLPRATVQKALEALEELDGLDTETECVTIDVGDVIAALRTALKQSPANVRYSQKELNEFEQMNDGTWEADRNG